MTAARATLAWALGASAIVHAALAVVPMARHGDVARAPTDQPRPMYAMLAPPPDALNVIAVAALAPLQLPAFTPSRLQSLAFAPAAPDEGRPAQRRMEAGSGLVVGRVLSARDRLGPMYQQQLAEFPIEISTPVRLRGEISVPYPAQALREGREDVVAVWVIVDAQGMVENVRVAQGSEEFGDAVIDALQRARFIPATDRLQPIRYPIALEFRFELAPRPESLTAQAN